eukprot:4303208-Pyramimonas_sp.AAC.1
MSTWDLGSRSHTGASPRQIFLGRAGAVGDGPFKGGGARDLGGGTNGHPKEASGHQPRGRLRLHLRAHRAGEPLTK